MAVSFENIVNASKQLKRSIKKTPVVKASKLNLKLDCELFLKLECLQLTSSFKTRGAFIAIKRNCENIHSAQMLKHHHKNLFRKENNLT